VTIAKLVADAVAVLVGVASCGVATIVVVAGWGADAADAGPASAGFGPGWVLSAGVECRGRVGTAAAAAMPGDVVVGDAAREDAGTPDAGPSCDGMVVIVPD
jgi:hypothetical protein